MPALPTQRARPYSSGKSIYTIRAHISSVANIGHINPLVQSNRKIPAIAH